MPEDPLAPPMAGIGKTRGSKGEPTPDGDRFMEDTPICDIKAPLKVERGQRQGSAGAACLPVAKGQQEWPGNRPGSGLASQHDMWRCNIPYVYQDVAAARYLNMPRAAATHS